jgi:hypothetical protein
VGGVFGQLVEENLAEEWGGGERKEVVAAKVGGAFGGQGESADAGGGDTLGKGRVEEGQVGWRGWRRHCLMLVSW